MANDCNEIISKAIVAKFCEQLVAAHKTRQDVSTDIQLNKIYKIYNKTRYTTKQDIPDFSADTTEQSS